MNTLNQSQTNSLWISLAGFEEALHRIERWLEEGEESGILYTRRLKLESATKKMIRKEVENSLSTIKSLAQKYGLERREESLNGHILGQLSICWADLFDTKSKRLKGYGKIDPAVVEEIDRDIESLSEKAMQIINIIEKNQLKETKMGTSQKNME